MVKPLILLRSEGKDEFEFVPLLTVFVDDDGSVRVSDMLKNKILRWQRNKN